MRRTSGRITMQRIALCLAVCLSLSLACAEEKPASGGKSPDGQYEVRVSLEKTTYDPLGYGMHIHDLVGGKRVFTFPDTGGYLKFNGAVERNLAHWHSSGRYVAITDQGMRHSRELYVVSMAEETPVVLEVPDFYQNALGRVGAVETDFAQVVTPQRWDGDDLILQFYFTANLRRSYFFEVILHLDHGPATVPRLQLKSVKLVKEEEG